MADPDVAPVTVEELLRSRLTSAIGGGRGALDSAVPGVAFVVGWTLTSDLSIALGASVVALVVLAAARVAARQTLRYVGYAVVGTAIAAVLALRSGRAQDAFLPGMIQTAAVGLAVTVANLVRWPPFGFLVAAGDPDLAETAGRLRRSSRRDATLADPVADEERLAQNRADEHALNQAAFGWRSHAGIVTVASRLGWVLVGLSLVRLAVMVPLYLAEQVAALGVAKLVLGWPAYLGAVAVMGLILVRGHTPLDRAT